MCPQWASNVICETLPSCVCVYGPPISEHFPLLVSALSFPLRPLRSLVRSLSKLIASLPSYYKIKCSVAELTGVESVVHHMCVKSCIAYTGLFLDLPVL